VTSFQELTRKRREYIEVARANGFEEGLRKLLAHLYPDNAHFIYELLQNAEDAGANRVTFVLESERLVVRHDGSRVFDLADIEAITGIGESTKTDDATRIGKFGVGFKAVFDYTATPEIRSGEHSFVIRDLFVPEPAPGSAEPPWTTFVFPFDRPSKPPAQACDEVARGLQALGDNTLLFLNGVHTVRYELPDGTTGLLQRRHSDSDHVTIRHEGQQGSVESDWIRLLGEADVEEEGTRTRVPIAAAFRLTREDATKPSDADQKGTPGEQEPTERAWRIEPLEQGEVSIYFPATKESSGLRFHIHAPFASTVARDSVRATPGNVKLVEAIGHLVSEALPRLRTAGLLDDGLLAALPNEDDQIVHPYDAIRDAVLETFKTQEITPVHGGGAFTRAVDLLSSPSSFRRALNHADLDVLARLSIGERETPYRWIAARDGRAGRFLRSLSVDDFGGDELEAALDWLTEVFACDPSEWDDIGPTAAPDARAWMSWLESKDEKGIRRLYEFLGMCAQDSYGLQLDSVPLVRLVVRGRTRHVSGPDTHLPATRSDNASTRVPVNLAVWPDDPQDKEFAWLRSFYERAGVKPWDAKAKVLKRLDRYTAGERPPATSKRHRDDIRLFQRFLVEQPDQAMNVLKTKKIFVGAAADGKNYWVAPSSLYIDEPYTSTGLAGLFGAPANSHLVRGRYLLWPGYLEDVDGIAEFAIKLGCQAHLRIISAEVQQNPGFDRRWYSERWTSHGTKRDWDLEHLDDAVDSGEEQLLRGVWQVVTSAGVDRARAVFQANGSTERHVFPSQAARRLESTAWIPDRDGNLRTPASITERELAGGLSLPQPPNLIHQLGFGRDAEASESEQRSREALATTAGFPSAASMERFRRATEGLTEEELDAVVSDLEDRRQRGSILGSPSDDPERRAGLAAEGAAAVPEREFAIRERSVAVGGEAQMARAKQYLRAHYSDQDGKMHCQVCGSRMPFQVEGRDYFEAIQFVSRRKRDHHQNRLALCPLCAAKYQHARATADDDLIEQLRALEIDEDTAAVRIHLTLAAASAETVLVARHAIDLRAALLVAGEERDKS
jgi:hypothetical protein